MLCTILIYGISLLATTTFKLEYDAIELPKNYTLEFPPVRVNVEYMHFCPVSTVKGLIKKM